MKMEQPIEKGMMVDKFKFNMPSKGAGRHKDASFKTLDYAY